MSSFKIGIIGAGYVAIKHLEVIKKIKGLKVIAITSRTYKKAEKIAQDFNIRNVFNNINSLIEQSKPDALLILVSAENIFEVTKKIIPFKIPFFVEKPPGLNLVEIKKLSFLANKYKIADANKIKNNDIKKPIFLNK